MLRSLQIAVWAALTTLAITSSADALAAKTALRASDHFSLTRVTAASSEARGTHQQNTLRYGEDASDSSLASRGGSVGAMKAGETLLNWSWKSKPTFRHTFLHHGEGSKIARSLTDTARTAGPQGQWLNNEAAAQFLAAQRPYIQGPTSMALPKGLGQVIMPDGSIVQATRATLVPSSNGGFVTAFPIP